MSTREYLSNKTYSINQLNDVIDGMEEMLAQSSEDDIIERLIGGTLLGVSLWITQPTAIAVATLVASLMLDTYQTVGNTRSIIEEGLNQLKDMAYTMYRYDYDQVKFKTGILEVDSAVKIYESALATAYHQGSGWIYVD